MANHSLRGLCLAAVDLVLKVTQFDTCCVECGGQPLSEEHDTASSGPDPNIMTDSSQGLLSKHVCCYSSMFVLTQTLLLLPPMPPGFFYKIVANMSMPTSGSSVTPVSAGVTASVLPSEAAQECFHSICSSC